MGKTIVILCLCLLGVGLRILSGNIRQSFPRRSIFFVISTPGWHAGRVDFI